MLIIMQTNKNASWIKQNVSSVNQNFLLIK